MTGNYPAGVTDNDPYFDVPSADELPVEFDMEPEGPTGWRVWFRTGDTRHGSHWFATKREAVAFVEQANDDR